MIWFGTSARPRVARLTATGLAVATVLIGSSVGQAASAATSTSTVPPIASRAAGGVSADALPTVQIDGVVWSQVVVGNTIYAGGSFANARPAGAAPGTNLTPRANLLAYNLTTGALITSFAPSLNGQVKSVIASPDKTRIYVGGDFTSVNGQPRYRLAAFSTATGGLITAFHPTLDATVNAIIATNAAAYVGGTFATANGVARTRLAAFDAKSGATLSWAPGADAVVDALVLTPDSTHVIVGGAFDQINGSAALGLASIDSATGTMVPFTANQVIKNYGAGSAILSLSTDGKAIYGTAYHYYGVGNLEGAFSADPTTGAINWIEDCHGDAYGIFASPAQVYVVSHAHYCGNIGAFGSTTTTSTWKRSTAFTLGATGSVQPNRQTGPRYYSFGGQPSPSMVNWFPDIDIGSYTGQNQGSWAVSGNAQYLVEGGEFLHVNGTAQQGLVRFAVPSIAPDNRGPEDTTAAIAPTATAASDTSITVSWQTNWDQDDQTLTYQVFRTDKSAPVYTGTANSQFWNRPTLSFTDTSLTSGTSYAYSVKESDPSGNSVRTPTVTIATTGTKPVQTGTVAGDTFVRTMSNGWGLANPGGAWTTSPTTSFATANGRGSLTLPAPGAVALAGLTSVKANNVVETVDVASRSAATGNGTYLILRSRVVGTSAYVVKLRFLPNGVTHLVASKVASGRETILSEINVPSIVYLPGSVLRLRVGVGTVGTRTTLTGTVWPVGQTMPVSPQLSAVDTGVPLPPGSAGVQGYLSGSSTDAPTTLNVDNLSVVAS